MKGTSSKSKRVRRSALAHKVGMTAAGAALAATLCPLVEERKHIDVPEYVQVNPVGGFAVVYASTNSTTVALTGVQATGSVGNLSPRFA